jgi:DNA-binding CsgD family transcriptional regulator
VLDQAELTPGLLQALGSVVPFEMACWGLLDPATLWPVTNCSTSSDSAAALRAWEYELTIPDFTKIAELARAARHVGILSAATNGHLDRSARYRMVLAPLGVSDELRAVLTVDGISWGWLALLRFSADTFTTAEAASVEQLVPHLARAWRAALLAASSGTIPLDTTPAVVVVDEAGRVDTLTAAAQDLLDQLPRGRTGAAPDVLGALAISARAAAAREPPAPGPDRTMTRTMLPGADGSWVLLEAASLSGPRELVAVTIRRARRSEIGELLLRTYGLTNRETQVALAVLRHETNQEIASALSISAWTVQDHLKAIFAKTGVRARRELAIKLFKPPAQQGPPRTGPDLAPGQYLGCQIRASGNSASSVSLASQHGPSSISGHTWSFHTATASSSRSRAWRTRDLG